MGVTHCNAVVVQGSQGRVASSKRNMSSQAPRQKEVNSPTWRAGKPKCGDINNATCELPGMAYPRCKTKCHRSIGHPGKCWCSFHDRYPWNVRPPPSKEKQQAEQVTIKNAITPKTEAAELVKRETGAADMKVTHEDQDSKRDDHPLIDPKTRGSKRLAMHELKTKEDRKK